MSLVNFNAKVNNDYFGSFSYPLFQYGGFYNYFGFQLNNQKININPFKKYKTQYSPKISLKSGKIANLLSQAGYDSEKGKRLTQAAKTRAKEHGWTGYCARQVRLSLEETHLLAPNNGNGHAYQYADTLSNNRNFREIDVSNLSAQDLIELSKFDGIVYVYGRGVSNYDRTSGHIEISLGNGTNGSDGITHHIRKGARVFIPVKTSILA